MESVLDAFEWQRMCGDDWVFGKKVRGIVREDIALIYYDEDIPDPTPGGWVWIIRGITPRQGYKARGVSASRVRAVIECESELLAQWYHHEQFYKRGE